MEKICIVGLGLMGASLAGALQGFMGAPIEGMDKDPAVRAAALEKGIVSACHEDIIPAVEGADMVIFCVYARHIPRLLGIARPVLKEGVILTDICGVKTPLYEEILPKLPPWADYTGLHPMAGRERDGIENADAEMFRGTGMLVCPTAATRVGTPEVMRALAAHIGCGHLRVLGYRQHDELIAHTSDLPHIAAAALCLAPHAGTGPASTAGAFRDGTRVADINPAAWSELLLENRENTLAALDVYMNSLAGMRAALQDKDEEALYALLSRAGENKRDILAKTGEDAL